MQPSKQLSFTLRVFSYLAYSSTGESAPSRTSRLFLVHGIKRGDPYRGRDAARYFVEHLSANCSKYAQINDAATEFLKGRILVPVPRSAPHQTSDFNWPSLRFCNELHRRGFGKAVELLLARATCVTKSATAGKQGRPTVEQHQASLRIEDSLPLNASVTIALVDDIISRGTTLYASALELMEALPEADVVGFTAARTCNEQKEITNVVAPCTNQVIFNPDTGITQRRDSPLAFAEV